MSKYQVHSDPPRMSNRKLNADELRLHQAALAKNEKSLSIKDAEKLIPDGSARTAAINFLLGAGMFKVMTSSSGVTAFRAVMKKEMDVKKDMSGEEAMVLGHIQASGNEGIWTKHLKAKTELHQTVIDRCLKSLVQKQLVKSIKAVRHPTRKIYMLAHLEPSVELTGGPWYTDNELDTEFIKLLSTACLHYIRDRSFPKQSGKRSSHSQPRLYAIGAAPSYPSAQQIQHFLSKSKITETELGVEHVEMLLRVLELDGGIEKLPAFAASAWDSRAESDAEPSSSSGDSDEGRSGSKKRKRVSSKNKNKESGKRKRRRTEDSEDSDSEEERSSSKKKKSSRMTIHKSRKDDDSDSEESEGESHKKKKRKGKSKKRDSSSSESSEETESDDQGERRRSKSKFRSSSKRASTSKVSVKRRKSPSPVFNEIPAGGAFVYRAIRQERVALGWSQAPCGRCPVFDFCQDKGPTNPQGCVYYDDWYTLGAGVQKAAAPAMLKVEF
ncbi:RNA polymerase Rpc34 [Boletus edulis BED1]|uniref:RNA polymerase Rpc34 n=1 Tax=Boletus edulis BED1 TaxID=1328754 RepID=A0AAD4C8S2_BOLED|nr:RNA polymerase Rpc34 [Boletus edulis BED1]